MMFEKLEKRLQQLPLILAGPILRHTAPDQVSVWLVTRSSCEVQLEVFPIRDDEEIVMEGTGSSLLMGKQLHLSVVTARSEEPRLHPRETWGYQIHLKLRPGGQVVDLREACGGLSLAYADYEHPSFVLPSEDLEEVRLLYGSCRKPHGEGQDALEYADLLIEKSFSGDLIRPQQLFMIGDQIYADDVADGFLKLIDDAVVCLAGKREHLPGRIKARYLQPGHRERTAGKTGGFTSAHKKNHLFSLGEYLLMYVMVWSDVLWPESLPKFEDIYPDNAFWPQFLGEMALHKRLRKTRGKLREEFENESKRLDVFRKSLPMIRRALANITTYMIFDDHDVTDDWYLNRAWTNKVLKRPLGKRVLLNGYLSFALCQAWGNTPDRFLDGPYKTLLKLTSQWMARGQTGNLDAKLAHLIGLPKPHYRMRELTRDPEQTCDWHFRVYGPRYEIWLLDTRTMRGFPGRLGTHIPDLISGLGWNQLKPAPRKQSDFTLVIAPTNVIDVPITNKLAKIMSKIFSVYAVDYGDTWEAQTECFERLLGQLASSAWEDTDRQRFIFLSGDVHYGFATRIQYWGPRPYTGNVQREGIETIFAQLTSSPFHNQNNLTKVLHEKGYLPSFPKPATWAGWHYMPWIHIGSIRGRLKSFYLGFRSRSIRHEPPLLNLEKLPRKLTVDQAPDWRYRVDFLEGKRADEQTGGGEDIVGLNNLGELVFECPDDPDGGAVIQRLWWRDSPEQEALPRTEFSVSLCFEDEKRYPKPLLPGEN